MGDMAVYRKFRRLFDVSNEKQATIKEMGCWEGNAYLHGRKNKMTILLRYSIPTSAGMWYMSCTIRSKGRRGAEI